MRITFTSAGIVAIAAAACLLNGCTTVSESARPRPATSEEAARANLTLGIAYVRERSYELAIEALTRALSINPRLADAHSTIAIAYDQLGDVELAEEHYRRATELERDNAVAANSYAVFLCRRGRWSDAEPYFRRAVENPRYPTPDVALTNAGICARNAGDEAAAEQFFREALTRNNTSANALAAMMDLSFSQGNYLRARAFMQRYLESQPPTAQVLTMCVEIETELGNEADADDCRRTLSERFPGAPVPGAEAAQL
ncbi:MAG: type IV pilus biogenesis/stability protein PilW [Gammaproteobacteria bacterium]|jgi:type IV pilus assembly protein PilF